MDELSQKWEGLSDIAQATITELVAGKHQGNIMSALMANFDTAREALNTSLGSSGSAMKEHAKWSESLEARLNKLKAAWQSLSQSFLNSDLLKIGIDLIIGLVDAIDKLIGSLGSFGTIGFSVGIYGLIKNFSTLKPLVKDVFTALTTNAMGSYDAFTKWSQASDGLVSGGKKLASSLSAVTGAIGIVVAAVGLAYNAYKKVKEEAAAVRQETIQTSNEFLDAANSFEQTYIKYSGKTNLTAEEESELESAIQSTTSALNDKSSALQNIVNSSNDYVASLETIAREEIKESERVAKAKKDAAKKNLEEAAIGWERFDGSEVNIAIASDIDASRVANEMDSKFIARTKQQISNDLSYDHLEIILSSDADTKEIIEYYDFLLEYKDKLSDAGLEDTSTFDKVNSAINRMSESIEVYIDGTYEAAKAQYQLDNGIPKTVEEYVAMREAILNSEDIKDFSVDTKMSILGSLDSEYSKVFDLSDAMVQARKFIGIIDEYGDTEANKVETFLNMRTAVNSNECTVGRYMSELENISSMTSSWSDSAKNEFNLSFGIDTDSVKQQYDDMTTYLLRQMDTTGMLGSEIQMYKENASVRIKDFLGSLTSRELAAFIDIRTNIDWENSSIDDIRSYIEEKAKINDALNFKASIDVDTVALETFNTALGESASAIGLTSESISALESKYKDLDGYDSAKLFEATANGVKLNREEVAKLEKKYNDLNKTKVKEHLDTLVDEYNRLTREIDDNSNAAKRAELLAERKGYLSKIEELAQYQAQLEGVTGAYQRWIDAQSTSEDYEGYEAVANGWETVKDEISRGFLGNASKEYIDLLSGEDLRGKDIDAYAEAWGKLDDKVTSTGYSIKDFFTINDDGDITATGIHRFFESIKKEYDGVIYKQDELGNYFYDFSKENLEAIQKDWGIGIEAIGLLLEGAVAAGYNIDWNGILGGLDLETSDFETLLEYAEAAQEAFNKLKDVDDVDFNFKSTNIEDATSELEKAQLIYKDLITNDDDTVNLDAPGAEQMRVILAALTKQKQELERPAIMDIEVSSEEAKSDIGKATKAVQNLQNKLWKLEESSYNPDINSDEVQEEINKIIEELNILEQSDPEIYAKLGLDETQIESLKTAISNIQADIKAGVQPKQEDLSVVKSTIQGIDATVVASVLTGDVSGTTGEATITPKPSTLNLGEDFFGEATITPNPSTLNLGNKFTGKGTINVSPNKTDLGSKFTGSGVINLTPNPTSLTVTVTGYAKGTANAIGSALSSGTAASGRAFARGNWGIKGSGTALGGELGRRYCDHT